VLNPRRNLTVCPRLASQVPTTPVSPRFGVCLIRSTDAVEGEANPTCACRGKGFNNEGETIMLPLDQTSWPHNSNTCPSPRFGKLAQFSHPRTRTVREDTMTSAARGIQSELIFSPQAFSISAHPLSPDPPSFRTSPNPAYQHEHR
jgi:hypothetical protein